MNSINRFIKILSENKMFKKLAVPVTVVLVGIILIIISPWQTIEVDNGSGEVSVSPINPTNIPGAPEDNPGDNMTAVPTPMPEPEEPDEDTGIYNPLTGRPVYEDISKNRPWAVSIGNTPEAQPLWGISRADIILEYLIEGSTRFMAFYQDISNVGTIRGIRSFRTSSMEMASGFDAIHTHWGGRTYNDESVYGNPTTKWGTFDAEWDKVGFRVPTSVLNIALEHRAAATGEGLLKAVPSTFRTEHEPGYTQPFEFVQDGTPANGMDAKNVTVSFYTNSKTTLFEYNESESVYYPRQYKGNAYIRDGIDGKNISFTNVLIIQTRISPLRVNEGITHMQIGTVGEGTGYFMCGGKYIEIKWSRENSTARYNFTLPNGGKLNFGAGKTYICMVDSRQTQVFS